MSEEQLSFNDFLQKEVEKYRGIYVPVKAGLLRRAAIRFAPCKRLHPNPDDEFCFPEIGPKREIIAQYGKRIVELQGQPLIQVFGSRITVQKIRPDGYLILNGHHRWAAAMRYNLKKVSIQIVDLTQEEDLRAMFRKAKNDKRVTFDLDEVVFCHDEKKDQMEKRLSFPLNKIYKERLCLGIPALFHFFRNKGYDVWVYSANYYSADYIRNLFRHYHVEVTGIITGTERKVSTKDAKTREQLEKEFKDLYAVTVHVDRKSLVRIDNRDKTFDEYELNKETQWSAAIMDVMREISSHERENDNR
ncbi:MAG: ParB N-terminal domain-containing protein [Clostridia bacterium]|nr:ParB N-terminal domain-containing protein [Clostridia bacterium]